MTISVPTQLVYSSDGDGATSQFSYPVRILEAGELVVLQRENNVDTTLTLNTDYTLSGIGDAGGVTITMLSVPIAGQKIVRYRATAPKQIVDLKDKQTNPAEAVEQQLDRLAMVGQDHDQRISEYEDRIDDLDTSVAAAAASATAAATSETNAASSDTSAEAAADRAEAAAGSVEGSLIFYTRADAELYAPETAPDVIRTAGYATAGDGGGALYRKKLAPEADLPGDFSVTLSDDVTQVRYAYVPGERGVNVLALGAVADGVEDPAEAGSEFSGTDNTAAFQDAMDLAYALGPGRVLVPANGTGKYYFAPKDGQGTVYLTVPSRCHFIGEGMGAVELLIDHNRTDVVDGNKDNWFFATPDANDAWDVVQSNGILYDDFSVRDITLRGLWDYHHAAHRMFIYRIRNMRRVRTLNVHHYGVPGHTSASGFNDSWYSQGCIYERCASGAIRSTATPDVQSIGDRFLHIDDDVIDCHDAGQYDDVSQSRRARLVVDGGVFFDCESILILAAAQAIITNNVFTLMKSSAIAGIATGGTGEGPSSVRSILVAGNVIEDTIKRVDITSSNGASAPNDTNGFLPDAWQADNDGAGIFWGGGVSADNGAANGVPGKYNAIDGAFIRPYDTEAGLAAGFMHAADSQDEGSDATVTSGYGSSGVKITANVVRRTLPEVAAYSDWGGDAANGLFTKYGWVDLAVTDGEFVQHGVYLLPELRDSDVNGNTITGFPRGAGVLLGNQQGDKSFERVSIRNNDISDVRWGIAKRGQTQTGIDWMWDVAIVGNRIDVDPYHQQAERTSPLDGSWQDPSTAVDGPSAICMFRVRGLTVKDNIISNCQFPWVLGTTIATDWYNYCSFDGNEIRGVFAAEGWSASNKGIGVFRRGPDETIRVATWDSDPTSATYGNLLSPPVLAAPSIPTSGFFFQGQFVRNLNAAYNTSNNTAVLGWLRLTTGTSHVEAASGVGGDWETVVSRT